MVHGISESYCILFVVWLIGEINSKLQIHNIKPQTFNTLMHSFSRRFLFWRSAYVLYIYLEKL
jgi:hypothetical protein